MIVIKVLKQKVWYTFKNAKLCYVPGYSSPEEVIIQFIDSPYSNKIEYSLFKYHELDCITFEDEWGNRLPYGDDRKDYPMFERQCYCSMFEEDTTCAIEDCSGKQ